MQEEAKLEEKDKNLIKEEMGTQGPQIPGKRKSLEERMPTFFSNLRKEINLNAIR